MLQLTRKTAIMWDWWLRRGAQHPMEALHLQVVFVSSIRRIGPAHDLALPHFADSSLRLIRWPRCCWLARPAAGAPTECSSASAPVQIRPVSPSTSPVQMDTRCRYRRTLRRRRSGIESQLPTLAARGGPKQWTLPARRTTTTMACHLYEEMAVNGRPSGLLTGGEEYKYGWTRDPNSTFLQAGLADLYFKMGGSRCGGRRAGPDQRNRTMWRRIAAGAVYLRSLSDYAGRSVRASC